MELNYLKCDSIQTRYPFELKFATFDVRYICMLFAKFDEYSSNSLSTGKKEYFLYIAANGGELFKVQ